MIAEIGAFCDRILGKSLCALGDFAGRRLPAVFIEPWDRWLAAGRNAEALRDAKIVAFVHAETSTGVQSDAKTLIEIAHPKFREELYEYCERTKWLQRPQLKDPVTTR